MTVPVSVEVGVIQKIIAMLKTNASITKYTGQDRIYGSHIATIVDAVFPAVSIHMMPMPGRETSGAFDDHVILQIEPWMWGRTAKVECNVWDDILECHGAIVDTLHRMGGWDNSIGIKILEITNLSKGPQLTDDRGAMHFPSLWRVRATL